MGQNLTRFTCHSDRAKYLERLKDHTFLSRWSVQKLLDTTFSYKKLPQPRPSPHEIFTCATTSHYKKEEVEFLLAYLDDFFSPNTTETLVAKQRFVDNYCSWKGIDGNAPSREPNRTVELNENIQKNDDDDDDDDDDEKARDDTEASPTTNTTNITNTTETLVAKQCFVDNYCSSKGIDGNAPSREPNRSVELNENIQKNDDDDDDDDDDEKARDDTEASPTTNTTNITNTTNTVVVHNEEEEEDDDNNKVHSSTTSESFLSKRTEFLNIMERFQIKAAAALTAKKQKEAAKRQVKNQANKRKREAIEEKKNLAQKICKTEKDIQFQNHANTTLDLDVWSHILSFVGNSDSHGWPVESPVEFLQMIYTLRLVSKQFAYTIPFCIETLFKERYIDRFTSERIAAYNNKYQDYDSHRFSLSHRAPRGFPREPLSTISPKISPMMITLNNNFKEDNTLTEQENTATHYNLNLIKLPENSSLIRLQANGCWDLDHFFKLKKADLLDLFNQTCSRKKFDQGGSNFFNWEAYYLKKNMSKIELQGAIGKLLFGNFNAAISFNSHILYSLSPKLERMRDYTRLWYYEEHKIIQRQELAAQAKHPFLQFCQDDLNFRCPEP